MGNCMSVFLGLSIVLFVIANVISFMTGLMDSTDYDCLFEVKLGMILFPGYLVGFYLYKVLSFRIQLPKFKAKK